MDGDPGVPKRLMLVWLARWWLVPCGVVVAGVVGSKEGLVGGSGTAAFSNSSPRGQRAEKEVTYMDSK